MTFINVTVAQNHVQSFSFSDITKGDNCTYTYEDLNFYLYDWEWDNGIKLIEFCENQFPETYSDPDVTFAFFAKDFLAGTKITITDRAIGCLGPTAKVYCDGNVLFTKEPSWNGYEEIFEYEVMDVALIDSIEYSDIECKLILNEASRTIDVIIENSTYKLEHFQVDTANNTEILLESVDVKQKDKPPFKIATDGTEDGSKFKLIVTENPAGVDLSNIPFMLRIKEDPNEADTKRYGKLTKDDTESSADTIVFKYTHPNHATEDEGIELTIELFDGTKDIVIDEFPTDLFSYQLEHYQGINRANSAETLLESVETKQKDKPPFKIATDGSDDASIFKLSVKENPGDIDLTDMQFILRIKEDPNEADEKRYGKFTKDDTQSSAETIVFKYTHPDHIPENAEKELNIELFDEGKGLVIDEFPVELFHSPVLMVHGLWSNSVPFIDLDLELGNKGFNRNLLFRTNYESTHAEYFANNNAVVTTGITNLQNRLKDKKIAGTKIDIVGHSMGGILSRLYLQSNTYQNDIGKLITLNTPHSGSQISNYLKYNTARPIALRTLLNNFSYDTKKGAIDDLNVNSIATIANLNGGSLNRNIVPSHAIASTTTLNDEINSLNVKFAEKSLLKILFGAVRINDSALFNIFNNEASDLIVPLSSQIGGCSANTTFIGPTHIQIQSFYGTIIKVEILLRTAGNDPLFSNAGFKPPTLVPPPLFPLRPNNENQLDLKKNTSFVNIDSPKGGLKYNIGDEIPIKINTSSDIDTVLVFVSYLQHLDSIYAALGVGNDLTFNFLGDSLAGTRTIYAIGLDSYDNIFLDKSYFCLGSDSCMLNETCKERITGQIISAENCDLSNINLILKDGEGNEIENLTTNNQGIYSTQDSLYLCGDYTIEIDEYTLPNCYNGETGPISFTVDFGGDNGVNFTDTDINCVPPQAGVFECTDD